MSEHPTDDLGRTLRECGARYIVNTQGQPLAVLLTLEEYGSLGLCVVRALESPTCWGIHAQNPNKFGPPTRYPAKSQRPRSTNTTWTCWTTRPTARTPNWPHVSNGRPPSQPVASARLSATTCASARHPMSAKYRVELLDRRTRRQLDRIHQPDFGRIAEAILKLEHDPRPPGCRKLREFGGLAHCGPASSIPTMHARLAYSGAFSLYEEALAWELEGRGLTVERQKPVLITYKGRALATGSIGGGQGYCGVQSHQ